MSETATTDRSSLQPKPKVVRRVISLHGIRTRGAWQKALNRSLEDAGFRHDPLDYGLFGVPRLLWARTRDKQVEWFRDEYTAALVPGEPPPSIIAHSFGTYIVASALERFPEIVVDQVIFCGAIVRTDYPWDAVQSRKQVARVLNEYGGRDRPAGLVEWFVVDAGPSGRRGFARESSSTFIQHPHGRGRHSDYFYPLHFSHTWVPFLRGELPLPTELPAARTNWKFRITAAMVILSILAAIYAAVPVRVWEAAACATPFERLCRSLKHRRIQAAFGRLAFGGFRDAARGPCPPGTEAATFDVVRPRGQPGSQFLLDYRVTSTNGNWTIVRTVARGADGGPDPDAGLPGPQPGQRIGVTLLPGTAGVRTFVCALSATDPPRGPRLSAVLDLTDVEIQTR